MSASPASVAWARGLPGIILGADASLPGVDTSPVAASGRNGAIPLAWRPHLPPGIGCTGGGAVRLRKKDREAYGRRFLSPAIPPWSGRGRGPATKWGHASARGRPVGGGTRALTPSRSTEADIQEARLTKQLRKPHRQAVAIRPSTTRPYSPGRRGHSNETVHASR